MVILMVWDDTILIFIRIFSVAWFIYLLNAKNSQKRRRASQHLGHVLKAEMSSNNFFLESSSYIVVGSKVGANT